MELRSVEELMDLLHACRGSRNTAGHGGAPVDLHDHALQTAALLRRSRPADKELQVAGLVHVIGQLLRPGDVAGHAEHAADTVRPLLGERVSRLVRLHQDGWEDDPVMEDVQILRQADEASWASGLDAGVLEDWRTVLELVSARHARPRTVG